MCVSSLEITYSPNVGLRGKSGTRTAELAMVRVVLFRNFLYNSGIGNTEKTKRQSEFIMAGDGSDDADVDRY